MKMRAKDLRKRLMVKFKGEEGLDYGGVARWVYSIRFFLQTRFILPNRKSLFTNAKKEE